MKKLLLLFVLALSSGFTFSQLNPKWCGSDYLNNLKMQENGMTRAEFGEGFYQNCQNAVGFNAPKATIIVPVVVHVIHNNGDGNISMEQIQDGLDVLNADYNRLNADASSTRNTADAPFAAVADSITIEFKLARYDENQNCTNGVVRVNSGVTDNATMEEEPHKYSSMGGSDAWNPSMYFNIWVVNNITSQDQTPGTITLGYALFPEISSFWGFTPDSYGLTIRSDRMGTIEEASGDGRTITHEVGHCFGLAHIFENFYGQWVDGDPDGCHSTDCTTRGDGICDTPPQSQAFYNCNLTLNSCNDIPVGDLFGTDVFDQIENYMSYNSCTNMFSTGQMDLMRYNIYNDNYLSNVISQSNINFTGVNSPDVICQADFGASQNVLCPGASVMFTDFSYHSPTTWDWSVSPGTEGVDYVFAGGTSSTDQNPEIQFLTEGLYDISLTAGDGVGTASTTQTEMITILTDPSNIVFLETFESIADLNSTNKWSTNNSEPSNEFEIYNGFGHTGDRCVGLNNFSESSPQVDELISAPVDLSVIDAGAGDVVTLSFRYAYRKKSSSDDEWLRVYISEDCGETWGLRKTIHGSSLSSLTSSSSWQPTSQDDWETVHVINITSAFHVANFMYKFEFEGSGGNNIYFDNINIYDGTSSDDLVIGIDENNPIENFRMYPNPATDELNVGFNSEGGSANISIVDLTGKIIQEMEQLTDNGTNKIQLNTSSLKAGVYLLKVQLEGAEQIKRFVIK